MSFNYNMIEVVLGYIILFVYYLYMFYVLYNIRYRFEVGFLNKYILL